MKALLFAVLHFLLLPGDHGLPEGRDSWYAYLQMSPREAPAQTDIQSTVQSRMDRLFRRRVIDGRSGVSDPTAALQERTPSI